MKGKLFGLAAIAAIIALIAACSNPAGPDYQGYQGTVIVTGVTVSPPTPAVLVGTSQEFTATVLGTGNPPQYVTWSVEDNEHDETIISTTGVLSVHLDETAETLTVRAASTHTTTESGTATVTVISDPALMPTVTGVTVTPSTATVNRGGSQTFSATVTGTNNPPEDVTWTVEGGVDGTSIDNNGLLTVAAGETAASLTVMATSTFDTTVSRTAVVTVPQPTVTGVILNTYTAVVLRGGSQTFSATVTGTNNPPQDVTWTVTGGGAGTFINESGVLTVAAGETAARLTVTATSNFDGITNETVDVAVPIPIYMSNRINHGNVPFYISRHHITQRQWYEVMAGNNNNISATPSHFRADGGGAAQVHRLATANFPVEMVSWFDALVFANRLSDQRGRTPVYTIDGSTNPNNWGHVPTSAGHVNFAAWNAVSIGTGDGYRLPTSAQWEFAGRAGATAGFHDGTNGLFTPGGSSALPVLILTAEELAAIKLISWTLENSGGRTHQVGTRAPNTWDLFDIHGNVYDWLWNFWDNGERRRSLRGGSWYRPPSFAHFLYMPTWYQHARLNHAGLRIMRLAN